MRKNLERQTDRIEAVLSLHKVPARVTGGTVTPRWVRFQVLPAVGAKISKIKNLSEELAAALDAPSCRVSRRGAAVAIEVPRDDPQPVRLLPLFRQLTNQPTNQPSIPPVAAILGLAEDGSPLLIRLPSPDVGHILITGDDGAGKTTLLRSIVVSLALASSPDEIAFVFFGDDAAPLARAVEQLGHSHITKWTNPAHKHVILVADNVTSATPTIPRLAREMGQERLHFVLTWDGVPPARVADLFKARLVGRAPSVAAARITTGLCGTGAERLLGRGDFLAIAEGKVMRFQAACISEAEIREATPSLGQPTHRISLPWPVNRLTQAFDQIC